MARLRIEQREYLKNVGYSEDDIFEINRRNGKTKYYDLNGNAEIIPSEARRRMSDQEWLTGIARALFHYTSVRGDVLMVNDYYFKK